MRSTILTAVAMVFSVAIPTQAKQAAVSAASTTPAKTKIASGAAFQPTSLSRSTASTKEVRLFLPPTAKVVAKDIPKPNPTPAKPAVAAPAPSVATAPAAAPASASTPTINGVPKGALARLTAYWTDEDYYTSQHMSATGVRLQEGHCAVDPNLIPYGSVVNIPGMGSYRAVDTGSAVVSRQAAIGAAHNASERNALVVDLFFENRQEAEEFAAHGPAFVSVSWNKPAAAADAPLNPRALPAEPEETARVQVYVLESAPSLAECRLPLNFRSPTIFQ